MQIVYALALPILGLAWAIYAYAGSNHQFFRKTKMDLYQQVIASSEEPHEAYFDGVPPNDITTPINGWLKDEYGWIRSADWSPTARYLEGAKAMNISLAGIALVAPEALVKKCFELENIAQMPFSDLSRDDDMNQILTLMRTDLNSWKITKNRSQYRVKLEWR
jgi:hypothetical protein